MNPQMKHGWGAHAPTYGVLVHGGAGLLGPEGADDHRQGCEDAARAAAAVLRAGGSALDAVQCAVESMEDNPLYNAGTGGALTLDGRLELDASIMDGHDLRAGAVCCLPPFRHPIAVARAVLEEGVHVLYAAAGADAFAKRAGFAPAAAESMITQAARERLARLMASQSPAPGGNTVGAIARDLRGGLAAATSTGGIVGQRPGRVGDTPIIGAGTYADDLRGAASATGAGEGILRMTLCSRAVTDIAAGLSPELAARNAIDLLGARVGTTAGLILIGPDGRLGLGRSTPHMPWAAAWDGAVQSGT
jgi:beta-aspartyl-peptidase (threonine type)